MMNHVKFMERTMVHIKLNNGNEWLLKYVRNIPAMKRNFISIWQLGDKDYLCIFGEMWQNITKGALVIAKGNRIGTLYLCPHNIDYSISVAFKKTG